MASPLVEPTPAAPALPVLQAPAFWSKPFPEQRRDLEAADPRFRALSDQTLTQFLKAKAAKYRPASPLAPPPSKPFPFLQHFESEKARVPAEVKARYLQAGYPESVASRHAQKITQALDVTPGSLARDFVIPLLVQRLIPAGRTPLRIGGQVLGNILGSASVEGGQEALTGGDISEAFVAAAKGGLKGIPGGLAQGITGGILGPNRATIKAQRAVTELKSVLPASIGKYLDPQAPSSLFSGKTLVAMNREAGGILDSMEATVGATLKGKLFQFPPGAGPKSLLVTPGGPAGPQGVKVPFEEVRGEIKRLRNLGDRIFADPEKQRLVKQKATLIEQALVKQMPPSAAQAYTHAIEQFAEIKATLRAVKAVQASQQTPGGLNRLDSPIVAMAIDILRDTGLSPTARASAMAVLAASGHPFMALHFAKIGGGRAYIDPLKVKRPLGGTAAGPLSALAGTLGSLATEPSPER